MAIVKATIKGQVVIPAHLRKKYGIAKGTRVSISEGRDEAVILLRPLPDDPIMSSKGMLKGGKSVLKALLDERKAEAERG